MGKVFTGALAFVKVEGVVVGRMQNIRASEQFTRARVGGLGTILPQEVPVTQWAGSFNCSFYLIDWDKARIASSIRRDVQTNQEFEDYLLLQENGIQLDVFKKVSDAIDPETLLPRPILKPAFIIRGAFTDSEAFNLAENQVGGHDQSFMYINPIIQPK